MKKSMQQWQIQTDKSLALKQVDRPSITAEQVLIRVEAIGVNRADILQVQGLYPAPKGFDNQVPGLEYVGRIERVGEQVSSRQIGERVMGLIPSGAYSEYLAVDAREALSVPAGLSVAALASIPEAFLTAYRALFIEGNLQAQQTCLIRPASAAMGLAAVQLAKYYGAKVLGSSRQKDKLATAMEHGLDVSVLENEQLAEQLKELTQGQGVHVVMDMLGSQWQQLQESLAVEGSLISVGIMAGNNASINVAQILLKRQKIQGMTMRSQNLAQRINMAELFNQKLLGLFEQSVLKPLPVKSFAFGQAEQAHQDMLNNDFVGKRVLLLQGAD